MVRPSQIAQLSSGGTNYFTSDLSGSHPPNPTEFSRLSQAYIRFAMLSTSGRRTGGSGAPANQIHSGGRHDRGSVAKAASHPQAEDRDSVACTASHMPFCRSRADRACRTGSRQRFEQPPPPRSCASRNQRLAGRMDLTLSDGSHKRWKPEAGDRCGQHCRLAPFLAGIRLPFPHARSPIGLR